MRHPTDGTLRRLVDEPAGVTDADRDHVAGCPECLAGLAAVQQEAALVGAALGATPDLDLDAAWSRLSAASAAETGRPVASASPSRSWRSRLRSPVVAGVGVAVLLAGGGTAAANDWFQIFRTEQVAPLSLSEADLVRIPDLSAYGDLEVVDSPELDQVDDAADAGDRTGLEVPHVDALPRGVTGEPTYRVGTEAMAVFTFDTDRAARTAADAGEPLPEPPAGLDGAQIRLSAGPGVAAVWQSGSGAPALLVGRAVAPTASSSGVDFAAARDYLLSMPGLPEDLAAQLRGFSEDGTLPIPVLTGEVESSEADVDGSPATVLSDAGGVMTAVVWVEDGVVTAVAGTLSPDELRAVADDVAGGA